MGTVTIAGSEYESAPDHILIGKYSTVESTDEGFWKEFGIGRQLIKVQRVFYPVELYPLDHFVVEVLYLTGKGKGKVSFLEADRKTAFFSSPKEAFDHVKNKGFLPLLPRIEDNETPEEPEEPFGILPSALYVLLLIFVFLCGLKIGMMLEAKTHQCVDSIEAEVAQ